MWKILSKFSYSLLLSIGITSMLLLMLSIPHANAEEWRTLSQSRFSLNIDNPVWKTAEAKVEVNEDLEPIRMNLPAIGGTLEPNVVAIEALKAALADRKFNDYAPSAGLFDAKRAVVKKFSTPTEPFTANDVYITTGAGHALQVAIQALASPGQHILLPDPGWNYYRVLCQAFEIECPLYHIHYKEDHSWIDLPRLEELVVKHKPRAILVNNPTNPHGAIFGKKNLEGLLEIADRHKLPIISDETFRGMEHNEPAGRSGEDIEFHSLASLEPKVPMLITDGIGKRYLLPGWRVGWVIVHDRHHVLKNVHEGIASLCKIIVGPSTLVQAALPDTLAHTSKHYFGMTNKMLAKNAKLFYDLLSDIKGIVPFKPQAGWFILAEVRKDYFKESVDTLIEALRVEQNVHSLAGSMFGVPYGFRIPLLMPKAMIEDACKRMKVFFEGRELMKKK